MLLRTLAILAVTMSLAAGCSGSARDQSAVQQASSEADLAGRGVSAAAPASLAKSAASADAVGEPALPEAGTTGAESAQGAAPMLIRTANASVQVADVDSAVVRLRALAARLGGYVTSSTVQSGDYEVRSATLEIKVPAPRFDEALSGLQPLGKVEYVNVNAQDVGEEFTDVTARVANARRLEARLLDLLANRTGKLEDVLAVERELARVREEIDRYEGRLRYLGSRVAMSTLSATVHEKGPLAGTPPGRNPIVGAFADAWRNFVGFVAGFIALLGILVPLGVLAVLAVWIGRRVLPRRSRKAAAPPAPPAA